MVYWGAKAPIGSPKRNKNMKPIIISSALLLGFIATAALLLASSRSEVIWFLALGCGLLSSLLGCAALEYSESHDTAAWKRAHDSR
jgi:hypothetical protein